MPFCTELETSYMKLICRIVKNSLGEKKRRLIKNKIQDFKYFNLFERNPQKFSSYLNFLFKL